MVGSRNSFKSSKTSACHVTIPSGVEDDTPAARTLPQSDHVGFIYHMQNRPFQNVAGLGNQVTLTQGQI